MSDRKKCQGTNRQGGSCGNKASGDSGYCYHHNSTTGRVEVDTSGARINGTQSSNSEQFNTECPACLSAEGSMHLMPCMHRIHLDCARHMTTLECPLCRTRVNNFPTRIQREILDNHNAYRQDLEEEDRQNLRTREQEVESMLGDMSMYVAPPPQVEVIAAMQFLRNEGIPLSYLPTNIRISMPRDSPRPPSGTLFYAVLGHVMERIDQDIKSGDIHGVPQPTPFEPEDDESDEENPFDFENENLAILSRSVQVRNV